MPRIPFFAVRHEPPPLRRAVLMTLSFLLPLGVWCAVSYLPFLWHPLMELRLGGGAVFAVGDRIPKESWRDLVAADEEWFAGYKEHQGKVDVDGVPHFHTAPETDPIPGGRRVRRSNSKAIYSYGPALLQAGLITKEQERDVDALVPALKKWSEQSFAGQSWRISEDNKQRVAMILETFAAQPGPDGIEIPGEAVLPPAAPQGFPANPVFLPAPHEVAVAIVTGFTTAPPREEDPWLHERLVHSLWIVVKGFGLALLIGLPLGVIAGSFPAMSKLIEPVTGFVGYIPPPAFAALLVAVLGLKDGPKVGIVFIASVFPMIVMVANTVRNLDRALLEAAQTLGASRRSLVMRVIIPGSLPRIYDDIRVLLALGWTILIIAEITGEKSGLSAYMEQQGRYRHYENVFSAMLIIGSLGLVVDRFLAALHPLLFPWHGKPAAKWLEGIWWLVSYFPRLAAEDAEARDRALAERLGKNKHELDGEAGNL